jgi:hypothetical protein
MSHNLKTRIKNLESRVHELGDSPANSSTPNLQTIASPLANLKLQIVEKELTKLNEEFERYAEMAQDKFGRVVLAMEYVERNINKYAQVMEISPNGMLKRQIAKTLVNNRENIVSDTDMNSIMEIITNATKGKININFANRPQPLLKMDTIDEDAVTAQTMRRSAPGGTWKALKKRFGPN